MDITQARAVVTGGASGLGNAVAKHIAARGGQVALLDIQEGPGQAAAAEIGAKARFLRCDVSSEADVNAAMDAAAAATAATTFDESKQSFHCKCCCR